MSIILAYRQQVELLLDVLPFVKQEARKDFFIKLRS